jgi:hypothetical protein
MLEILGALFLVGMTTAMLATIMNCFTVSIVQTLKYGSLWCLFPAVVYMITQDMWLTLLSIWIPTFFLVNKMNEGVCDEISGPLPPDAQRPSWTFSIWDYLPESISLSIPTAQIPTQ